jgi:LPXTG-site transpeptidase (sortase) family protein
MTNARHPHRLPRFIAATSVLAVMAMGATACGDDSQSTPMPPQGSGSTAAADTTAPTAAPAPATPPPPVDTTPPADSATEVSGTPARVAIPAIGVDAPVVDLGKNSDGTLEVPDWQQAGWWRRGPEPGERGPAVIAGHVDSTSGPDVFYRLEELQPGDRIDVQLDDGGSVAYAVQRIEVFPKDAFPTLDVYELTPGPELRLITCDGEFDDSTGHYVDNLIVFATPA